jgi:hypothetical protein
MAETELSAPTSQRHDPTHGGDDQAGGSGTIIGTHRISMSAERIPAGQTMRRVVAQHRPAQATRPGSFRSAFLQRLRVWKRPQADGITRLLDRLGFSAQHFAGSRVIGA